MAKEILYEMNIDGKELHYFSSFIVRQEFNAHHTFELTLDQDVIQSAESVTLEDAQDYVGRFLTVCFGDKEAGDNTFKGIITEVGLSQEEGLWGKIVLKGYSPTFLMEGGPHYTSFENRTLKDLLGECTKNVASNDMNVCNNPVFNDSIPYICQYGESNFRFINRLATEYGESFFYDGLNLYLGKPASPESVDLIYGKHISSMNFSMRLMPANINHYSYNSKNDQLLQGKLPGQYGQTGSYTQKALEVSEHLYRQPVRQPVKVRVSSQGDLDRYSKVHKQKVAASTVLLKGEGDSPKVKLGHYIKVKVSKKSPDPGHEEHGEYIVTRVEHRLYGIGAYENSFEAIPSYNEVIPVPEISKPVAENQIAYVKDNNDPDGMGRVRVQMLWQQEENLWTDWLRILTPDAGGSDKVSKNRGFVFIPEVGDQVVISFRYNDPNRPFVLGSMFNGKSGGGGGSGNNSKSLTSKSGCTVTLDDAKGSVVISDPGGSTVTLNGDGTMTISAPDKINIQSKEINIIADEKATIKGTNSVTIGSKEVSVDGSSKTTINSKAKVAIGAPSLELEGSTQLKLQSTGIIDVEGTTMTNLKGGMLNLNCG